MNLPDPKYTVEDPEGKHKYVINHPERGLIGPLKSVTKIVGVLDKPALIGWAAKEAAGYFKTELLRLGAAAMTPEELERIAAAATGAHRRKAKDAADLGTACHAIFEAIIAGKEPEVTPPELVEPKKDFLRWRLSTDIEIVAQELAVGSAMLEFGGRLDAVGYSKSRGGFGIVDYKTSSGFYGNEYAYQVGGYALAIEEQYDVPVTWAEIVRFGKKPPYDSEARPVTDLRAAIDAFAVLASVAEHQDAKLIGEPSFSTAAARAAEAVTTKASTRKKQPAGLGF
jgi:hypothetical protein